LARRRRKGRNVSGILVLNKPQGITSNRALQQAKRLFDAAKAGHTGSLDPLATGVLPVCFGEATKFSQFLLDADKGYKATFTLGEVTDSCDSDGEIIQTRDASAVTQDDVLRALAAFTGEIEQVPPMYSALKHQGQPLHKLARKGVEVERKARRVMVSRFELLAFTPGERATAEVVVHCSKGTYIRSLALDVGEQLGCGGHVSVLHRTAAGPFNEEAAVTLEALQAVLDDGQSEATLDRFLLPTDAAVAHLPRVDFSMADSQQLLHGQAAMARGDVTPGTVRLYDADDEFFGVGDALADGRVKPRRLVVSHD